jgi:hypothetical protein
LSFTQINISLIYQNIMWYIAEVCYMNNYFIRQFMGQLKIIRQKKLFVKNKITLSEGLYKIIPNYISQYHFSTLHWIKYQLFYFNLYKLNHQSIYKPLRVG